MKLTKKFRKMAAVLLTTLMVVMVLMTVPFTASAAEDTDNTTDTVYPGGQITVTYSFAKDIPAGCPCYLFRSNYPLTKVKYKTFENHWVLQPMVVTNITEEHKNVSVSAFTAYGPEVKSGEKIISLVYDVIERTKLSDLDFSIIELQLGDNNLVDYSGDLSYFSYDVEITSKGEKPTEPTTVAPATTEPTTEEPTTEEPTEAPTTVPSTTVEPTTEEPTEAPTTEAPTTVEPTTVEPTTVEPTEAPTTEEPTIVPPTTVEPTTEEPTEAPTTEAPTTVEPTEAPATEPTTVKPATEPTEAPTKVPVVTQPATAAPSTEPTQPATVTPAPATPDEPSNGGNGSNDNGIVKTGQNMPAMIPVSIITMALTFAVMKFCRRKRSK